ncbi:MAG: hypothetical protein HC825_04145 [Oscillatoriales cyanobacterium RM1_1_9]|nr:hypothetical protein [Oscillatoriales cyanobacterium SM2_3_0]NJO46694.1 hypothetical protein [Oscillatoriales cyanobacterium RM2_1_1]NJO71100.1 hypothetical protein [Oscillatoriales cyanobacterium RM1_1_9]
MIISLELALMLLAQAQPENTQDCVALTHERTEAIAEIDRQTKTAAEQFEAQLKSEQFQQQIQQRQRQAEEQLNALLRDEAKLKEFLQQPDLPAELVAVLNAAQENPGAIKAFLEQQTASLPDQIREQIQARREALIQTLPSLPVECPQN